MAETEKNNLVTEGRFERALGEIKVEIEKIRTEIAKADAHSIRWQIAILISVLASAVAVLVKLYGSS